MRNLLPLAAALLVAVALTLLGGPEAVAAQGRRAAPSGAMRREHEPASVLGGPIAAAQASLEKLEKDKRRRKYRDGWDAIANELAAAIRKTPADPRSDEARLLVARVREELWGVSRSALDARVAVQADLACDTVHPGSEAGRVGLIAAVRVAHRARLTRELAQAAKRLSRYPRSTEVNEALALAPAGTVAVAGNEGHETKRETAPSGVGIGARAATAADRKALVPAGDDEEEKEEVAPAAADVHAPARALPGEVAIRSVTGENADRPTAAASAASAGPESEARGAASPAASRGSAAPAKSSLRTERAGRDAPASPEREPDTDVPAGAAHAFDQLVQAARAQGAGDLVGDPAPGAAAEKHEGSTDGLSSDRLNGNHLAPAAPAALGLPSDPQPDARAKEGAAAEAEADDDAPPEPEVGDEEPAPHRTLASAPRVFPAAADAESERRAKELRKSVLSGSAGSMAAQLGLKVHKVVVDAGHGGKDTGAIGPHGLREKDVTLAIARKLVEKLRASGLEVVMTRKSDEFVSLNERTRLANEANADLFISVHCNAARRKNLSGVETWTLNVSADRYAQRLAAFENAETEETVSNLRMILADLATKANASDARELADTVQASMVKTLRTRVGKVKDNGVKQALFYVLLGTHMPSILVETAFLSNPEEEKRLRSAKYQDGAAEAIARGVKQYIGARRELARAP